MAQDKKPGALSLWFQRTMNGRTNARIRKDRGGSMGMELLILHTTGRRSGQPRETPVSWFADPGTGDARFVVASGGGSGHPAWYLNLMAHPEQASIELPGQGPVPVTPESLDGDARAAAWAHIAAVQPRFAKYQGKAAKPYPVVRLAAR